MKNFIERVKEFNSTAGGVTPNVITDFLSNSRMTYRIALIKEELDELQDASKVKDIIEERDAISDLLYVILGYAIERGFSDKIVDDFYAVHRSNMTKFDTSEGRVLKTKEKYNKLNIDTYYRKVEDLFVTYRKSDNKILKSEFYVPVKLI